MKAIVAALLLAPVLAHPCSRTIYHEEFATAERAAIAGLGRILVYGDEYEYAGYVVEVDGKYRYSEAVTQHNINRVNQGCYAWRHGWRVAAVFHTHMADPNFSKADKRQAARLGVPSYVCTLRDGWIVRYDPETRITAEVGTLTAEGERVRWKVSW